MRSSYICPRTFAMIRRVGQELLDIAKWIGVCGVLANHFPVEQGIEGAKMIYIRDSDAVTSRCKKPRAKKRKRSPSVQRSPGELPQCPRWVAVRDRIRERIKSGGLR